MLADLIASAVHDAVSRADTLTRYREPLIGFAAADDPRFAQLHRDVHPGHLLPHDLLPGAQSVIAYFVPFAAEVVEANATDRAAVAREWAAAYVETNALLARIANELIGLLSGIGARAAAEPPTHNFDPVTLVSRWSHKSAAVIAGLGSFGLHQLVITDSGCAGRFGSVVTEAVLPVDARPPRERCLYFHDGSCLECVAACPAAALSTGDPIDKQACWQRLLEVAVQFQDIGTADVCGKCSCGPCALGPAV